MPDKEDDLVQLSKDFLRQAIAEGNEKLRIELKTELIEDLTKTIEKTISDKLQSIQLNVSVLETTVESLKQTASDAYDIGSSNSNEISNIKTRLETLEVSSLQQSKHNEDLQAREVGYKKDIEELKRVVDDQINRNMRGNLVFFGLPETETETFGTKSLVADFIYTELYQKSSTISQESISGTIVRAHRGRRDPKHEKKGPRPIYVKFNRDDTAAVYLRQSIIRNVSKNGVRVKQQFTKALQERRDKALKTRRELFNQRSITKAFVEYPATLKAIYNNSTVYTVVKQF